MSMTSYTERDGKPHAYLGDACYAVIQNGMIELRANDIDHPSDTVYLEESVLRNLIQFARDQKFIE
jgi:hypothetical protein